MISPSDDFCTAACRLASCTNLSNVLNQLYTWITGDDAPATGQETVLVCVDTYLPTCLGKSNARLVTCTSNWYK
jgi:hypothetical protein